MMRRSNRTGGREKESSTRAVYASRLRWHRKNREDRVGADGGMAPQIQHFFSSSGSWEGGEEIYVIVLVNLLFGTEKYKHVTSFKLCHL